MSTVKDCFSLSFFFNNFLIILLFQYKSYSLLLENFKAFSMVICLTATMLHFIIVYFTVLNETINTGNSEKHCKIPNMFIFQWSFIIIHFPLVEYSMCSVQQ